MFKKILPVLALPVLLAGCATSLTNLTPKTQERTADNLYRVEVAMASRQQTLRWKSIKPFIVLNGDFVPMRPTPMMTNRWEGVISVPPDQKMTHYRYKVDFDYNAVGGPRSDSVMSPDYTLRIVDKPTQ